MINKINTLRTVANNLTSHIFMEGKTIIKKPGIIIPGAIAAAGTVLTLETKDNNASLIVEKDKKEIQRASFNYNETPSGYELASAMSSYCYDDKEKKELYQNHYLVESGQEKTYETSINYANAPVKKTTRAYIDKINSSIAQTAGYQSYKTDYDPQENHTYGKKSLQRDFPALLQFLDIVAPNSEFTLKLKDKLKKDNKTSLVAFEAHNTENGNKIARGFMATNDNSVSYRINTEDMTLIGEQSLNINMSKAYLKPERTTSPEKVTEDVPDKKNPQEDVSSKEKTEEIPEDDSKNNPTKTPNVAKASLASHGKKEEKSKNSTKKAEENSPAQKPSVQTVSADAPEIEKSTPKVTRNNTHVHKIDYYSNLIVETATSKNSRGEKAKLYKKTIALAYLDGYNKSEMENILSGNGLLNFSYYCKKSYIDGGIELAEKGDIKEVPTKTLDNKIKEIQDARIDINDTELKICFQSMINEIGKIEDTEKKEAYIDKALDILKNNSSKELQTGLLSFVQEVSTINDDLKLHYEIYIEFLNNKKKENLKSQIEQMINNISDATHFEKRGEFLTRLYTTKDIKELKQLQNEIQQLLNEQSYQTKVERTSDNEKEKTKKFSITTLSSSNQKLVKNLLDCKSPSDMCLTFYEMKNLLLDIGFTKSNVDGSHHKFIPPAELFFNGRKQPFLILTDRGRKIQNPAQIEDLINVCRLYYGKELSKDSCRM